MNGYFARVERGPTRLRKFFSDAVYGKQARKLAIAWREERVLALPPEVRNSRLKPPGYYWVKRKMAANYKDGVRQEFDAWVGFLRIEDRKHLLTQWSVEKWGVRGAEKRCRAWLVRKVEELEARLEKSGSAPASPPAPAKAVVPPKSATPPVVVPPKSKPPRVKAKKCRDCGGQVLRVTGPGREYPFRPGVMGPIPVDFPTDTCQQCGEHSLTLRESDDLERLMEEAAAQPRRKAKVASR